MSAFDEKANLLTTREREVADCIAKGMSDDAIAEALVISTHTVKTHVRSVLRKLEVKSRHQVAAALAPKITPRGIDPGSAQVAADGELPPGSISPPVRRSGKAFVLWSAAALAAVVLAGAAAYAIAVGQHDNIRASFPASTEPKAGRQPGMPWLPPTPPLEDDAAVAADLLTPIVARAEPSAVAVPGAALSGIRKTASPLVLEILADGIVTRDEVTAATMAAYECTVNGTRGIVGVTLETPAQGDPWHVFGFTATTKAAGDQTHEVYSACIETYYRDVATAWSGGRVND